jgi:hypothetical protein
MGQFISDEWTSVYHYRLFAPYGKNMLHFLGLSDRAVLKEI